jgi:hypothetical protein
LKHINGEDRLRLGESISETKQDASFETLKPLKSIFRVNNGEIPINPERMVGFQEIDDAPTHHCLTASFLAGPIEIH